jgi:hypothetical protein
MLIVGTSKLINSYQVEADRSAWIVNNGTKYAVFNGINCILIGLLVGEIFEKMLLLLECGDNRNLEAHQPYQVEADRSAWMVNKGTDDALSNGINHVLQGCLVVGLFKKKWALFSNTDCRELTTNNTDQTEPDRSAWMVNGEQKVLFPIVPTTFCRDMWLLGYSRKSEHFSVPNAEYRKFTTNNPYQMEPDRSAWIVNRGIQGALSNGTSHVLQGCLVVGLFKKKWTLFSNADCREFTTTNPYQMELDRSAWIVNGGAKRALSNGINHVLQGCVVVRLFKKKPPLFSNADCRESTTTNLYQMEADRKAWVADRRTKGALSNGTSYILLGDLVVWLFKKKWLLFSNTDYRKSVEGKMCVQWLVVFGS